MSPSVTFREVDETGKPVHEYKVDGLRMPSVTYVLDRRGFTNYGDCPEDNMEAARERGKIGHEVTEWFDQEYPDLLLPSVSPANYAEEFQLKHLAEPMHPWTRQEALEPWIGFRQTFGFCPEVVEKAMAWKINGMMVCGKPDCFGRSDLGPMLVEKKFTAKIESACKYQLAGYAANPEFWDKSTRPAKRPLRFAAHFRDGKCVPVPFTRAKDEQIFAAALSITHDLWNSGGK